MQITAETRVSRYIGALSFSELYQEILYQQFRRYRGNFYDSMVETDAE